MRCTRSVFTKGDFEFLRNLPVQKQVVIGTTRFYLVHAAPTDPLFGYRPQASQLWEKEVQWVNADILLVGHTHTPFVRQIAGCTIVNPGSLGQPKTGRALACYATWEDGAISLKEYGYPLQKTIRQIRRMPLSKQDIEELAAVLETGGLSIPGASPVSVPA
jgi:putative phosphoesterase